MTHFALTEGDTEWGEHLTEDEYPNRALDSVGGCLRILVFPHDDEFPPGLQESERGVPIALDVLSQLRCPPIRVRLRENAVLRAYVPVAATDLRDYAHAAEHNVVAPPRSGQNLLVDPIAEPAAMEFSTER
jgi:hypothetical protein